MEEMIVHDHFSPIRLPLCLVSRSEMRVNALFGGTNAFALTGIGDQISIWPRPPPPPGAPRGRSTALRLLAVQVCVLPRQRREEC